MDAFTSTEVVRVYWRSDLQYSHLKLNLEWNTVVFLFHIFIGPTEFRLFIFQLNYFVENIKCFFLHQQRSKLEATFIKENNWRNQN